MISGIYSAVFASNNANLVGNGVAIFSGYAIYGGNASFYYKGKYQRHDGNNVSAQVEVVHYSGTPDSVLGPRETFRLSLNGSINDQGFTLSGQIVGEPASQITIALKKLENIVEV